MRNEYAAEIARLEPSPSPFTGWQYSEANHSVHMSDEGRAHIAEMAVIWDQHVDALNAFMEVYGKTLCRHNRPLDDLEWDINDYVGLSAKDANVDGCTALAPWFDLGGFHDDLDPLIHGEDWDYCLPFYYHNGIFMRSGLR